MTNIVERFFRYLLNSGNVNLARAYLIYVRLLSILQEVGEVEYSTLLSIIEPELRDVKLVNKILRELEKLNVVSITGNIVKFHYNVYEHVRKDPTSALRVLDDSSILKCILQELQRFKHAVDLKSR